MERKKESALANEKFDIHFQGSFIINEMDNVYFKQWLWKVISQAFFREDMPTFNMENCYCHA